ncbi:hypothetical protein JCM8097_006769 [Rhodosporidiobolus ruineniae]
MSGPTATEKATSSIPGSEHLPHEQETALHRATNYPVVKDTLSYTHQCLESYRITAPLYHRVAALSASLLKQLEPLSHRFEGPLHTADSYANATLDYIEKKVPQVKLETGELIGRARQPADQAYDLAQGYKNGLQQRAEPFTRPVFSTLEKGQETLRHLQERLDTTLKKVPHDQASLGQTLETIQNELDGLVKATRNIPAHVQETATPVIDGLFAAANDVRKELQREDIPIGAKAANVLAYSQDRLSPVLDKLRAFVGGKKAEVESEATELKDKSKRQVNGA